MAENNKYDKVVFIPKDEFKLSEQVEEVTKKVEEVEEVPKKIELSFDCKVSKETMDFFKKQSEELEAKENKIIGIYRRVAKFNARYYLPIMEQLASEDAKLELLEEVILKSICKGWNDCFDCNVKHIIK